MTHPDGQDAVPRAVQVCSHCKSIKKGCDKRLPSCSQCVKSVTPICRGGHISSPAKISVLYRTLDRSRRRRAVCKYGELEEPRRSGSEATASRTASSPGINHRLALTWTSIHPSLRSKLCQSVQLSLLLMNSLSEVFPSNTLDARALPNFTTNDSVVVSQVSQIFRAESINIEYMLLNYFKSIHLWLPIMSRKRFHDRFAFFRSAPSADFSVLLLAMCLITEHPSTDLELDQNRELLYLATKTLYAQVQSFIPSSLSLIQAGVILSHYEQAQGKIEAAYITVGTTARMAFAMDMHQKQCSTELEGSDAWLDDEEALCTWWGLVLCDRVISCGSGISGRPLATRSIRENDYLPLEPMEMERGGKSPHRTFRYYVSATSLSGVGSFGREAQAAYLYDKVRFSIETGSSIVSKLHHLGTELQRLLAAVMEQLDGRWGIYCGATQILITGLYMLYRTAHGQTPDSDTPANYKQTIEAALSTLTRMVIDIAYAFNRESQTFEIDNLAPNFAHVIRCAQYHIMATEEFHSQRWIDDFDQLRQMLSFFNRRWVGASKHNSTKQRTSLTKAGMELQRLNDTLHMSMSLPIR